MPLPLDGQRALLTGATGGIGQAIARALAARGARVLLSARRQEVLEELCTELGPDRAEVLRSDLADREAVRTLVERAGRVDLLVANAALPGTGALWELAPEEIDRALDVNLRAPMQLARALAPAMRERGSGHLVLLSSMSGKVGSPGSSVYSATKFGIRGFAAGLREDLHGTGVGVTVVFPGFVSGAGMFAEAGVELPWYVRTSTVEQVAEAVVRGVERRRAEVDVAPLGVRAGALASAVAPGVTAAIQRRLGARELSERLARGQADKR